MPPARSSLFLRSMHEPHRDRPGKYYFQPSYITFAARFSKVYQFRRESHPVFVVDRVYVYVICTVLSLGNAKPWQVEERCGRKRCLEDTQPRNLVPSSLSARATLFGNRWVPRSIGMITAIADGYFSGRLYCRACFHRVTTERDQLSKH